jgi:hypothetical protein
MVLIVPNSIPGYLSDIMVKFHIETNIEMPVEVVIRLFNNRNLLPGWQPGLISSEPLADKDGKKRYKLIYQLGRRKLPMTETIIETDSSGFYKVVYTLKGIVNNVEYNFSSTGPDSTKWIVTHTFHFKGLMKLIGPFMRGGLEQQSNTIMKNFKSFAERYADKKTA